MPHEEDQLLAQAGQGDPEAFSRLVELYEKPVYNLCYRMLGDRHQAEDAAQETFIRAFKAISRYDPNRKFVTWLLSIASNYCIDQHRKRRPELVDMDAVAPIDLASQSPGIEAQITQQEQEEQIQSLLGTLAKKDRAAVVLHYWYGYSYQEIAEHLSLSESAVKSRMHRARQSLAALWETYSAKQPLAERRHHESPVF